MKEVYIGRPDGIKYLEKYVGHVFLGTRDHKTLKDVVVFQFSDEPAEEKECE